jgi:hypothetical protein
VAWSGHGWEEYGHEGTGGAGVAEDGWGALAGGSEVGWECWELGGLEERGAAIVWGRLMFLQRLSARCSNLN